MTEVSPHACKLDDSSDAADDPAKRSVVVNLATGIDENPERMMLALFAAESALAAGKRVLIFASLDAVRAFYPGALRDVIPCEGCPSLEKLFRQVVRAGVLIYSCPVCLRARNLDPDELVTPVAAAGTAQMMAWIGDHDATVFSF